MLSPPHKFRRPLPYATACLSLAAALALTFVAFRFAKLYIDNSTHARMDIATHELEASLRLRMRMYVNALLQTRGLFTVEPELTPEQFHGYVQGLDMLRDYPGIQGLAFVEVLPRSQLDAHLARHRRRHAWYTVHGSVPNDMIAAVTMIEPVGGDDPRILGFDLAADPARLPALAAARDTGEPHASGRVAVPTTKGPEFKAGFGIYAPVYRRALGPSATVAERRAELRGFAVAPFHVQELFERVAAAVPADLSRRITFAVYDDDAVGAPLFDQNAGTPRPLAADAAALERRLAFEVAGRRWHLLVAPLANFQEPYTALIPLAVLALGGGICLLLFFVLWAKSAQARREAAAFVVAEAAAQRDRLLARSGDLLGSSLDPAQTLAQLARLLVPDLADWCGIYRAEGVVLTLETVAGSTPDDERIWLDLERRVLASSYVKDRGAQGVFASGNAELVADIGPRVAEIAAVDPELYQALRRSRLKSYIAAPMQARGRVVGVIVVAAQDTGRTYDEADLALVVELARRAALAVDNARLYDEARSSEARKASVLTTSLEAIITADELTRVIDWNPAAERIFGYTAAEAQGRTVAELIVPETLKSAHAAGHKHYMLTGQARVMGRRTELPARRKDGSEFPVELAINPSTVGGRTLFTCYARDITDRLRDEQELLRTRDLAEAASRAKSAFLANVSHEIRTPLGAMLGFSELLLDPRLSSEEHLLYAETIVRNGRDLTRLIDDVLDLSKVEAGRLEIERLSFELPGFLDEILQSLAVKARERGVALRLETDPALPAAVTSDPTRLRQILFNVVGNALKFTAKGSVTIAANFAAKLVGSGQAAKLIFVVTDTGRGIAPEQAGKLFQSFAQADSSTTRKFGGTGLGLVLARRLARLLGGDVELTASVPGEGSVFTVTVEAGAVHGFAIDTLPLSTVVTAPPHASDAGIPAAITGAPPRPNQPARAPAADDRPLAGVRVLVADDAKDNQLLFRRVLMGKGAAVDVVDNGQDAVDHALAHRYDVVLMDIQMPVLDGYDATKELRRRGFEGPIIALTAHAMKDERERCLGIGCNDHLPKPVRHDLLVETVSRYAQNLPPTVH